MFRALLWKEWRQLALVRWGGIALGALLPVAFTTGAELAKRGLLPTGELKTYSPRDLMFEVLPAALALGLWPLIALMAAVQAFAADRQAGTESFVLERPVPRGTVWRARLAAALGTLALVIALTIVLGASVAALAGAPPTIGWTRWSAWSAGGVAIALIAFLGGLIASSLLTSPMGALLAGAMLAGLPVLIGALLASGFSHARYGELPLGGILPVLMLPAYILASWASSCRGEPAGGGRVKRGVAIATAALGAVVVLFVSGAPIIVRVDASTGMHTVSASPVGDRAFVADDGFRGGGGWLVDVTTGRCIAFLAPPIAKVLWSPDGSTLATLTWSAPLGGERRGAHLEFRAADSGKLDRAFDVPADRTIFDMAWDKEGIVVLDHPDAFTKPRSFTVDVIDPRTGAWRSTEFNDELWGVLDGPRPDGTLYLRSPIPESEPDGGPTYRGYLLRPIDAKARRVEPPLADTSGRAITLTGWNAGLSPTGRFAMIVSSDGGSTGIRLRDLVADVVLPRDGVRASAGWISGDRLVWLDSLGHRTRLFVAAPGEQPSSARQWTDAQVGLEASPDRRAVFVSALPAGGLPTVDALRRAPDPELFETSTTAGTVPEEGIYLAEENRWVTWPLFSGRLNDQRYTQWAGPKTLARIAPGVVYFENIDRPGEKRFVIGGERSLR